MNRDALFQGEVLTVSDDLKSDDGVFIVAFAHRLRSHVHISFEVGRGTLEHALQLRSGLLWIARNGLADRVTRSAAAAQNHDHGHSQSERRDSRNRGEHFHLIRLHWGRLWDSAQSPVFDPGLHQNRPGLTPRYPPRPASW